MQDKHFEINSQPSTQSNLPAAELQMRESIIGLVSSLPLTPNQRKIMDAKVNYAIFEFPDNPRAAYLLAKKGCYHITEEELKELEPYCFFPEEHPQMRKFIRDTKTLKANGHQVEIVNRNPDPETDLDEQHLKIIEETLRLITNRTPQIAQRLLKIFLLNKRDTEKQEYGPNGEWTKRQCDDIPTGIVLTQQGYRFDIDHRIKGISNLQGTIVHELGHILPYLYPEFADKFRTALGYHAIREIEKGTVTLPDDEWEKTIQGNEVIFVHKPTGKKSYSGWVPKDLSLLPSDYACFYPNEDISDSFVAWMFGKPLDTTRQKLFDDLFQTIS